ncbi:uncharacterized protein LOC143282469 [Babylonia areolata]|uniref:uncharacterized protein LOC143282469 n=1 Tax=Babylonia areolata TaxID=304850 RepID=UPI003FCF8FDC
MWRPASILLSTTTNTTTTIMMMLTVMTTMTTTMTMMVMTMTVSVRGGAGEGAGACSSTFQVWQPDQDVLRQMEHVQLAVHNLTYFCQAQAAKAEVKVADRMTQIQNMTWRLERDVMSMQVTRMDVELQTTKMSAEMSNLKRELDDYDRRVDDLELDLYMLRNKVKDSGTRFERAELSTDMASMLKNSVGDLKAEWLLMKREIEALKRESRRLQKQRGRENNSSLQVSQEVRGVSSSLLSLQSRTALTEDLLRRLESRVSKVMADCMRLEGSLNQVKAEREEHRSQLSTLHSDSVSLQERVGELQVDVNRLRERQDAMHARMLTGNGGMLGGRTGENSPGFVIQSAAGENFIARDCHELYQTGYRTSGVYHIRPVGALYLIPIYCLMINSTGYTVVQRRVDGLLNFNRRWLEYQYGFGNPYGELWIGNDLLHLLTHQKQYLLRVDLADWEGKRYWAEYTQFQVSDSSQHYRLKVSGYTGDAGDSLSYHDNMAFSTEDVDNDLHTRHCAAENQGGWWFHSCFSSNLNGVYHRAWYSQASSSYADGVVWYSAKESEFYSMKTVAMMLKPKTP